MTPTWSHCWKFFHALAADATFWRLSGFLRQEAAPPTTRAMCNTFSKAVADRIPFITRLLSFRHVVWQLAQGSAPWSAHPLSPVLGFGTLVTLPHICRSALRATRIGCVERVALSCMSAPRQHFSAVDDSWTLGRPLPLLFVSLVLHGSGVVCLPWM